MTSPHSAPATTQRFQFASVLPAKHHLLHYPTIAAPPSHIRRLPTELLSEIFRFATRSKQSSIEEHDSPSGRTSPPQQPSHTEFNKQAVSLAQDSGELAFTLAAVCRRWRKLALGTPSLWTMLCVTVQDVLCHEDDLPDADASLQAAQVRLVNTILRSKDHAVDVFIDARDIDWNYYELGVSSAMDNTLAPYTHPFTADYMVSFLTIFLAVLPRWKTLTILTDTWAPMHAALLTLNKRLPSHSLNHRPTRLESIKLMRCNDLTSYCPLFYPESLAYPLPLNFGLEEEQEDATVLPSLKHITLHGVHVDWHSLPRILPPSSIASDSTVGLQTLDLSSHSLSVRPSAADLHNLLSRCSTSLCTLAITSSGISPPYDGADSELENPLVPVVLHELRELSMAFNQCPTEMEEVLRLFEAPGLERLSLADSTHPGELDSENDCGALLRGLALHPTACQVQQSPSSAKFPGIRLIRLDSVGADKASFWEFFRGQEELRRVEIKAGLNCVGHIVSSQDESTRRYSDQESTAAFLALLLSVSGQGDDTGLVCPRLKSLVLRGIDMRRSLATSRGVLRTMVEAWNASMRGVTWAEVEEVVVDLLVVGGLEVGSSESDVLFESDAVELEEVDVDSGPLRFVVRVAAMAPGSDSVGTDATK